MSKVAITQMSIIRGMNEELDCGKLKIHVVVPKTPSKKIQADTAKKLGECGSRIHRSEF